MWNFYCMLVFINSSHAYFQVHKPTMAMSLRLFHCRKEIFNQVRHFIHINLSVALLLGLIVFVSGIETASDLRVRIIYVYV